jgi:hypothetical protein
VDQGTRRIGGRRIAVLVTTGVMLLSSMGAVPASALDASEMDDATAFLESNMERFEVPDELRETLLEKALSGAPLDADVEGATPVAVETVTNEYGSFPIERFADGSFNSSGVGEVSQSGNTDVSARAVKDCYEFGDPVGQTGRECEAYHWTLWHNMWFHFDYEWLVSGTSRITAMPVGDRGFDSGNSCTTEVFGITQANGTSSSPARGDWVMSCTEITGASSSKSLGVRVKPNALVYTVQNY